MEGAATPMRSTALRGLVAAMALTSSAAFIAPAARPTGPVAARRSAGEQNVNPRKASKQ